MAIVVVGWYFIKGPDPNRGEIVLGRFGMNTLSSFPVQVFAFTCAQNVSQALSPATVANSSSSPSTTSSRTARRLG